jgi:DNA-binding NarL/FixJ family response regulator
MQAETGSAPVRVVIADDSAYFRAGLRIALETSEHAIEVLGEAETGREAAELVERTRPDVALLDVRMPDGSGIEAAQVISVMAPATRVLMLTISDDGRDVAEAKLAGAVGYLLKDRSLHDVVDAVLSLAGGSTWPLQATGA